MTANMTANPARTAGLPYRTANPSHRANSPTYIGLRLKAYGPPVSRRAGLQSVGTRSGRFRYWENPNTMIQTRRTAPTASGMYPSRFQPDGPPSAHPYRGPRWDRAHGMPACTAGRATSQTTGASASASHRGIPAGRGGRGSGDFAFPIQSPPSPNTGLSGEAPCEARPHPLQPIVRHPRQTHTLGLMTVARYRWPGLAAA